MSERSPPWHLAHFVALALLLRLAISPWESEPLRPIPTATLDAQCRTLVDRSCTESERDALEAQWQADERAVHQALAAGLHRRDPVVQARAQRLHTLLEDAAPELLNPDVLIKDPVVRRRLVDLVRAHEASFVDGPRQEAKP